MSQPAIHLVLFLSRATPLKRWEQMGILNREMSLYQYHLKWLGGVTIVTSGGKEELSYQRSFPGVEILFNRWKLSPNIYSLLAPWLHKTALRQASIYKTNQLDGAWTAILAGKLHHKPVIVRAGYLWAEFNRFLKNGSIKNNLIRRLQAFSLAEADSIIVTTEAMKKEVNQNYNIPLEKVRIIPNAVETDLFCPRSEIQPVSGRVCFVGRLTKQKNLDKLIEAISTINEAHLVLIGEGEEQQYLMLLAQSKGVKITFLGQLPNHQIPLEINRSEVFILPSTIEGHPKALIEAMACGAAVIGAGVPGIRELIEHGKTGWLCPPTIDGLRDAIQFLLANPSIRLEMGKNSRQFILDHFSLEQVTQLEKRVIENTFCEYQKDHDHL